MKIKPLFYPAFCALIAMLLAAPVQAQDSGRTIEVVATEFAFEPTQFEVTAGEEVTLRLVNEGNISHNLHLHLNGEEVQTETIQGGASDTVTFTAPDDSGELTFYCAVPGHEAAGMTGQMAVAASGS